MPARGALAFLLTETESDLGELARVGRVDEATAAGWVHELISRGYAVLDGEVCTVSDEPTDLDGASVFPSEGSAVDGGPDEAWAALKATLAARAQTTTRAAAGSGSRVLDDGRLTQAERALLVDQLDHEFASDVTPDQPSTGEEPGTAHADT